MTTPKNLTQWIQSELEEAKARDIVILPVTDKTSITDYMVICTGTSNRHTKSIADRLSESAKKAGIPPIGMEGEQTSEWVLVDLGDAIVHVMQQEARDFYQLEALWGQ